MSLVTRIYKYALLPTEIQTKQLEKCGNVSRFLWNRLVKTQRHAYYKIQNGHRATIESNYCSLVANKDLVGMRVNALNKLMVEKSLSKELALKLLVQEKCQKDIKIPVKKGRKLKKFSAKHLSWKYAVEKVNSERHNILRSDLLCIWTGIQAKWINFGESWDKGIFMSPRFKQFNQYSTIQKQINKTSKWKFGSTVDLSWCGSPALTHVKVIVHRELPETAIVKQIALIKNTVNQWFICVFIEGEKSIFQKKFLTTGNAVGIDPGLKTALTLSNGEKLEPNSLRRQSRQERKLNRLQRKLDRQVRQNNPDVFNENGTWKKGKRIHTRTKRIAKNILAIADIKRYFKDAKADYYHNQAIRLLNQFDNIAIGSAKIHNLTRGTGKALKSQNSKIREHSISEFVSKIKDKSLLSLTPKNVCVINEAYTSKTCHVCKTETNLNLSIRTWKCSNCNTEHDRDVNAAINIRNKMLKDLSDGSTVR